jgi:cytochrome c peroxidase
MFETRTRDRMTLMHACFVAATTALLIVLTIPADRRASGDDGGASDTSLVTRDRAGALATVSAYGVNPDTAASFAANLGTNGRSCASCHLAEDAWSFTPKHARSLASDDPLFSPNDGSDCPPVTPAQGPDSALSSELLDYGLIRVQLALPDTADFSLAAVTNPKGCAVPPGSSGVNGELFLFRRPLPTTNLMFDSAIMWDGRETLHPITTQAPLQSTDSLLFDLADQANSATTGHAQGASIAGTQAQTDIVGFETDLSTAQLSIGQRARPVFLNANGAQGGPEYLRDTVAPQFFIGVNDPLKPGFTNAVFSIFAAWEPTAPGSELLAQTRRAIGRGEAIFNNTTFVIHDVPGLNSVPSNPLYSPTDPLAGQDIVGGCGLCHNSPNVGNHSTSLPINIGVTMAHPTNSDGTPNSVLDIAHLPVYTLRNAATGVSVEVTDPGKAMISGKWTDIGKTKGPMLRGLGARAPYFHNGSAQDLRAVVKFYNARFNIGLTPRQSRDLVTFLGAL